MCYGEANTNQWAGYRIGPSPTPTYPKPSGCKSATKGGAHHVGSSSGLITIVAMSLFLATDMDRHRVFRRNVILPFRQ